MSQTFSQIIPAFIAGICPISGPRLLHSNNGCLWRRAFRWIIAATLPATAII
jgi:hypothetical protein